MDSGNESHVDTAGAVTPPSSGSPVAAKRAATAWRRPENGSAPVLAAPAIMDAESWPALPGLSSPPPLTPTKASPKAARPPPSTGTVISPISLGNSVAPDANADHDAPVTSPPVRRALMMPAGDGPEKLALGPEQSPLFSPNARGNGSGDHRHNGRFGSHPHGRGGAYGGGNRKGNGGGGSRHGQDHRVSFDGQRRGGGRMDVHAGGHQHRVHHSSYIRPPPLAVIGAAPPPPLPYVSPATSQTSPYGMGFPEMPPHIYYVAMPPSDGPQAMPFVTYPVTPPAMLISPSEHLRNELLMQIEYYFSDDNLCKDTYLRQHMDDQGWVPLSLIAGFKKVKMLIERIGPVKKLTNSLQFILDTVLQSTLVEVQGERIRRRAGWENWPLPNLNYPGGNSSGSLSPVTSSIDSLTSQFQSVGLEGTTYLSSMQGMPGEALLPRSATSVSAYHASSLGGLQNNRSGPIFGQNTSSFLHSDTF